MKFVVGLDVGGMKKGFHGAFLPLKAGKITGLFHAGTAQDAVRAIQSLRGTCAAVAIDAPPRARIAAPHTREAERGLLKLGYRVQWTRRASNARNLPEWMRRGELLWKALACAFPKARLFETFPTASYDGLESSDVELPLRLLQGKKTKRYCGDYVDACLCALGARAALLGKSLLVGPKDELGPIHILPK